MLLASMRLANMHDVHVVAVVMHVRHGLTHGWHVLVLFTMAE